ncbi:adaptin ear-binding coat-associated protein 1-like [Orbicella faveolata]|uniref:adaptin ear-binding coat-associated protein 1-like n=1 Tax=Orbicella faveolata TaxID=48498 RepID=UPI0009E20472|nr:adaptin ear-binding coat-associated protein 1-like [Orbicella faveolata]
MEDYESVLCVKNECFIYKIPPRTSNRGYRAADWKLDQPDWTGRLRVCAKGKECYIKIEDKTSGELFAKCPVDDYPGIAVEGVLDSSRYFVLKIVDETGRHAFIGMGFQDRGDSFDFNVSLQDHFKWIKQSEKIAAEAEQPDLTPKLDLSFKEGQTIHINLGNRAPGASATSRPKPAGGGLGVIPPPPGGMAPKLAPPPGAGASPASMKRTVHQSQPQAPFPDMGAFASSSKVQQQNQQQKTTSEWGDFTAASGSSDSSWVQF